MTAMQPMPEQTSQPERLHWRISDDKPTGTRLSIFLAIVIVYVQFICSSFISALSVGVSLRTFFC
jgi:hypothetical protein